MSLGVVSELWIYPIKSCGGISLRKMKILEDGPQWDRRWMLVDINGKFVSQREEPRLALIKTEAIFNSAGEIEKIFVTIQNQKFELELDLNDHSSLQVEIWGEFVSASETSKKLSAAISSFLGQEIKLVRTTSRQARVLPQVKFADSRAIQLMTLASLADLNERLVRKQFNVVEASRFRANVILEETQKSFVEDTWQEVTFIGPGPSQVKLSDPKPCSRCIMININPSTGARESKEPLATLSTYRKVQSKVNFGILYNITHPGGIQLGQTLTV